MPLRPPTKVSSPTKVLFPATTDSPELTKADVVAHYEQLAERMLPLLAGRPLTLQRFPNGVEESGFMQKNASKHFPRSIDRFSVPKRGGGTTDYPVVSEAADIPYLANQNTITFHMWTATAARPDHPDWLVMDLDPEPGDPGGARAGAEAVREVLAEFGLEGTPVATGSTGFHVWVPIEGVNLADTSLAGRALAGIVAVRHPQQFTVEFLKKNRAGRVFVDWLRNTPGATSVVPFSLRPRPGAPVAVPLSWDELSAAEPEGWRLGAVDDRPDLEAEPQQLSAGDIAKVAREIGVDLDTPHDRFGRRREPGG